MAEDAFMVTVVGVIRSSLKSIEAAPLQGDEGAPEAWLELTSEMSPGLTGIEVGDELIVLTWLHQGRRDVLQVHPRGNPEALLTGVFATRSPNRPNPIGLHRVSVQEVGDWQLKVTPLEAVDGTPVIDIKPVLGPVGER